MERVVWLLTLRIMAFVLRSPVVPAIAQRLEACANLTAGATCSWAGAFNSVQHGFCVEVGPTNQSVIACVKLPSAGIAATDASKAPANTDILDSVVPVTGDPVCRRGLLHTGGGVCCPFHCGAACRAGEDESSRMDSGAVSVSRTDAGDVCSVDFILRAGPPCASSGPPCVLAATQGAPAAGFAEVTSHADQAATTVVPLLNEVRFSRSQSVPAASAPAPAAADVPEDTGAWAELRQPASFGRPLGIGSAAGVSLLCICCVSLSCLRRARLSTSQDADLPLESPLGAGTVHAFPAEPPRKKKKKKIGAPNGAEDPSFLRVDVQAPPMPEQNIQPGDTPRFDSAVLDAEQSISSPSVSTSYGYSDAELFEAADAPIHIVDVWSNTGTPAMSEASSAVIEAAEHAAKPSNGKHREKAACSNGLKTASAVEKKKTRHKKHSKSSNDQPLGESPLPSQHCASSNQQLRQHRPQSLDSVDTSVSTIISPASPETARTTDGFPQATAPRITAATVAAVEADGGAPNSQKVRSKWHAMECDLSAALFEETGPPISLQLMRTTSLERCSSGASQRPATALDTGDKERRTRVSKAPSPPRRPRSSGSGNGAAR